MAAKCRISGASRQTGNRVSHANNKTKHVFNVNLQTRRIFVPSENRTIRVKLSTRVLRTIDKLGVEAALRKHGLTVADLS